ncbi:MAG: hypothetical protein WC216_10580 [Gallionella sp.]
MQRDVQLIVEDELSGFVLRKLVELSGKGLSVYGVLSMGGFGNIKNQIPRFKNASNVIPHIILTDLDTCDCAPRLMKDWDIDSVQKNLLFRVAVREVEAWLLADRQGIADYLGLPLAKIPLHPEHETDPKQTLLNLVRKCKRRRLIVELVPAAGSSASIGPLYNSRMGDFVRDRWDMQRAMVNSDSLSRAVNRISAL